MANQWFVSWLATWPGTNNFCYSSYPSGVYNGDITSFHYADSNVPYKATFVGISSEIVLPGLGDTGRCALLYAGDLPPNTGWALVTLHLSGNSTLTGKATTVQSHCSVLPLDPGAPPPPLDTVVPIAFGMSTITAANGDTYFGTYAGTFTVTEAGMVIDSHFFTIGGTGRFASAIGDGTGVGIQTESGAAITLTGTISSPGSFRRE